MGCLRAEFAPYKTTQQLKYFSSFLKSKIKKKKIKTAKQTNPSPNPNPKPDLGRYYNLSSFSYKKINKKETHKKKDQKSLYRFIIQLKGKPNKYKSVAF